MKPQKNYTEEDSYMLGLTQANAQTTHYNNEQITIEQRPHDNNDTIAPVLWPFV